MITIWTFPKAKYAKFGYIAIIYWAHLCAYMVGSYASLSVCPSICLHVSGWTKIQTGQKSLHKIHTGRSKSTSRDAILALSIGGQLPIGFHWGPLVRVWVVMSFTYSEFLRLEDTYAARHMKIRPPPCTFASITLLLDHHLWPFGQSIVPQIFERWSSNRVI